MTPRITQALRPAEDGTMKRKKKLRWGKTGWCTKPPRKIRYRNELDAKLALASTQRSRNPRRKERRYYRCPECKSWHLTSH